MEDSEYTFFELPEAGSSNPEKPEQEKPDLEAPALENPILGLLREYNIESTFVTRWLTVYDSCEPVPQKGECIWHPSNQDIIEPVS